MRTRFLAVFVAALFGLTILGAAIVGTHQIFPVGVKRKANLPDFDGSGLALKGAGGYILAGGQDGTWFSDYQYPTLISLDLSANATQSLTPVSGEGTVWSGGYNGSDWIVAGWGTDGGPTSPDPYFYLYNRTSGYNGTLSDPSAESEWAGGDIFGASSNGSTWFVSGMGSGAQDGGVPQNHLSAGLIEGGTFVDLTSELPKQMDGILYSNAFNGTGWLVGGGYESQGVLFYFNGKSFENLSGRISSEVKSFHSVQSVAWNGKYWLVGGVGFLAAFDGSKFVDLTQELKNTLPLKTILASLFSVNAIDWNGFSWLLGGGEPVAVNTFSSVSWLAALSPSFSFTGLSGSLPSYTLNASSSILSISYSPSSKYWVIGGYSGTNGLLLTLSGTSVVDLSGLIEGSMTYVDWVGST